MEGETGHDDLSHNQDGQCELSSGCKKGRQISNLMIKESICAEVIREIRWIGSFPLCSSHYYFGDLLRKFFGILS